jgi:hypothetical protein
MIRLTATVALVLTVSVMPAYAADRNADDAAAVSGSVAGAVAPLAADVDWSLPAVHVGDSSRGVLPALYVSLAGLQAYDGYSTIRGLRQGAVETNGIVKGVAGNPAAMWAMKAGVTTASVVIAERLWKQNRRTAAIVTMVATNGLMAVVAARNAAVLRAQR